MNEARVERLSQRRNVVGVTQKSDVVTSWKHELLTGSQTYEKESERLRNRFRRPAVVKLAKLDVPTVPSPDATTIPSSTKVKDKATQRRDPLHQSFISPGQTDDSQSLSSLSPSVIGRKPEQACFKTTSRSSRSHSKHLTPTQRRSIHPSSNPNHCTTVQRNVQANLYKWLRHKLPHAQEEQTDQQVLDTLPTSFSPTSFKSRRNPC